MNISYQEKILNDVRKFIVDYFNEDMVQDMQFLTGPDAVAFSKYASESQPYVSFDCSLYDFVNHGYETDNFKFVNEFTKFLEDKGLWYEQGESWNFNIHEI
jgi:hypothetical protein